MAMTRQDAWRAAYRARRYLENATPDLLIRRFIDIFHNLRTLTPEGKLGVLAPQPNGGVWMELFTHVLEEYQLRGMDYGAAFQTARSKGWLDGALTHKGEPPAARALRAQKSPLPLTYLAKLGKPEHLEAMLRRGSIRIAPASGYSDPSLNAAVRDDELSLTIHARGSEVKITVIDGKTGKQRVLAKPSGDVAFTATSRTDYYVYCLTHALELRLFDDFEARACVIVRDLNRFRYRLRSAVEAHLGDGWRAVDGPVNYVDPYSGQSFPAGIFHSKHLRYWYQREYRFAWIPETLRPPAPPPDGLQPMFLELGSLEDIAEMIMLPT
jgi:hypothetical protein